MVRATNIFQLIKKQNETHLHSLATHQPATYVKPTPCEQTIQQRVYVCKLGSGPLLVIEPYTSIASLSSLSLQIRLIKVL